MTRKKADGNTPKPQYWVAAILVIFVFIGVYVWYVKSHIQKPFVSPVGQVVVPGSSGKTPSPPLSLATWLTSNSYKEYIPLRNDMPPGSVLKVHDGQPVLALAAANLLGHTPDVTAFSPSADINLSQDIELKGDVQADVLPGISSAALAGTGASKINLILTGMETYTLPLDTLEKAIKKNPELKAVLKRGDTTLLVITEAIRAKGVECRLLDNNGATLKASIDVSKIHTGGGSQYQQANAGVITSTTPVYLGYKADLLTAVASTLGPGEPTITLRELSAQQLDQIFQKKQVELPPVFSQMQTFGLVVGQGNYAPSAQTGGQLPGAVESAQLAAADLSRIAPNGQKAMIETLTSREFLPGIYDNAHKLTKKDFESVLAKFTEAVKRHRNPRQDAVIFFYYFGHGLADGLSHSVFLVPEAFPGAPAKTHVLDFSDQLINLGDVYEQLRNVSGHVILLVDACREHAHDDLQLMETWTHSLGQSISNLGSILDVLIASSGIAGDAPIMFGSKDGVDADTVDFPFDATRKGIGPLALRLDWLMAELVSSCSSLDIHNFARQMISPIRPVWSRPIKAYPSLTSQKIDLPSSVCLMSASRQSVHVLPVSKPALHPKPSSTSSIIPADGNLGQVSANTKPISGLADFAPDGSSGRYLLLGLDGRLWQWASTTHRLVRDNIFQPSLGYTKSGDVYFYHPDNHTQYRLSSVGTLQAFPQQLDIAYFGHGFQDASVLEVDDDDTVGTPDTIYRLQGTSRVPVARFDTTTTGDVFEWLPNRFLYTSPQEGLIRLWQRGSSQIIFAHLHKPALLAATAQSLYCLSLDGVVLYRIDANGQCQQVMLQTFNPEGPPFRRMDLRGFRAVDDHHITMISQDHLITLDTSRLPWHVYTRLKEPAPVELNRDAFQAIFGKSKVGQESSPSPNAIRNNR